MSSQAKIFHSSHRSSGMKCWNCDNTKDIRKVLNPCVNIYSEWECQKCGKRWLYDERPPIDPRLLKTDKRARELTHPYSDKVFTQRVNRNLINRGGFK